MTTILTRRLLLAAACLTLLLAAFLATALWRPDLVHDDILAIWAGIVGVLTFAVVTLLQARAHLRDFGRRLDLVEHEAARTRATVAEPRPWADGGAAS